MRLHRSQYRIHGVQLTHRNQERRSYCTLNTLRIIVAFIRLFVQTGWNWRRVNSAFHLYKKRMSYLFIQKCYTHFHCSLFCSLEEWSWSWQLGIKLVTDNLFKLTNPVWLLCTKANTCVERSKQQSENKSGSQTHLNHHKWKTWATPCSHFDRYKHMYALKTYTYSHTDTHTHTHTHIQ